MKPVCRLWWVRVAPAIGICWGRQVLRQHTDKPIKWALPGPMTMIDTLSDQYYGSREKLAGNLLPSQQSQRTGGGRVDIIQFDEPAFNVFLMKLMIGVLRHSDVLSKGWNVTLPSISVMVMVSKPIPIGNKPWAVNGDNMKPSSPNYKQSAIDMVSLECQNSRVPMELINWFVAKSDGGRDWCGDASDRNAWTNWQKRCIKPCSLWMLKICTLVPIAGWHRSPSCGTR